MTRFTSILTHPGSSHKDEFLACCVLLALHPVPILRREPEEADLANPEVCVVDVGNLHEPERNNFDHHQFPKEHVPTCSLSLVLQILGLYEDTRQFCEWMEPAEWFDCRGPVSTAKWLGVERRILNQLSSPIDITLLRRFSRADRLEQGNPLWEVMRMIGEDMLSYVQSLRKRLDFIEQHSEIWELDLDGTKAKVLFLPRTDPLPDDPSSGFEIYVDVKGLAKELVGVIYPDRRSGGYGLSRFRDHPRFDFTRVADCPEVHFTHARGFLAKTTATDPARLMELLLRAATR